MPSDTGYWLEQENIHHCHDESLAAQLCSLCAGRTIIDLGCGEGLYVAALRKAGVDAWGVDGSPAAASIPYCRRADLTAPLVLPRRFDVALCLEVGEHIPASHEGIVFDNIAATGASTVVISWAVPQQGGYGHVNERPNDYVEEKLRHRGFQRDMMTEQVVRECASLPWFKHTLMVFHDAARLRRTEPISTPA